MNWPAQGTRIPEALTLGIAPILVEYKNSANRRMLFIGELGSLHSWEAGVLKELSVADEEYIRLNCDFLGFIQLVSKEEILLRERSAWNKARQVMLRLIDGHASSTLYNIASAIDYPEEYQIIRTEEPK